MIIEINRRSRSPHHYSDDHRHWQIGRSGYHQHRNERFSEIDDRRRYQRPPTENFRDFRGQRREEHIDFQYVDRGRPRPHYGNNHPRREFEPRFSRPRQQSSSRNIRMEASREQQIIWSKQMTSRDATVDSVLSLLVIFKDKDARSILIFNMLIEEDHVHTMVIIIHDENLNLVFQDLANKVHRAIT
uniref:Uncharacterized protein n=1 Tax=Aureoumbra lagunensis TaxID=44058 RepID=A0A7S3K3S5_9STRA